MKSSVSFSHSTNIRVFLYSAVLMLVLLTAGCGKGKNEVISDAAPAATEAAATNSSNGFGEYHSLSQQTLAELHAAKAATARYNNFENAVRDGYIDINVIVPEMGYHYLLVDRLDSQFDPAKPEILVYNRQDNGRMKLLAVEYAVPIALSPSAPAGFTGADDVWSVYQNTLWTLHAWVWEFNPAGVFNPTNPLVHVH